LLKEIAERLAGGNFKVSLVLGFEGPHRFYKYEISVKPKRGFADWIFGRVNEEVVTAASAVENELRKNGLGDRIVKLERGSFKLQSGQFPDVPSKAEDKKIVELYNILRGRFKERIEERP
jgi:hypothetical protein